MAPEFFHLPSGRAIAYEFSHKSEPSRPTILLSNSLASQYPFWDDVVARLHDEGFRTIRYDHPGHGQSGVPGDLSSTTFQSLAEDVYSLLTSPAVASAFEGGTSGSSGSSSSSSHQPPRLHAWIGDSLGAALGIVFVTTYPGVVRSLVVCDTIEAAPQNAGVPDVFAPRVAAARAAGSMDATVEESLARWVGRDWMAAHPAEAGRLLDLMRRGTSLDGFETCIAALRSPSFDLRPLYGRVARCVERVLLVVGEKDADLPVKMGQMRDALQRGFDDAGKAEKVDLHVIPQAGHLPFVDNYDAYMKVLLPFLKR